jgi:polygalacturonase
MTKIEMTSRREFTSALLGLGPAIAALSAAARARTGIRAPSGPSSLTALADDPWLRISELESRIIPPVFPQRDFELTRYGAVGDGMMDCSDSFVRAIRDCAQSGGGRVVVSGGSFLTGPIHLKSNVNLHVAAAATIKFSTDPARYLPPVLTRFEGMELMNYSPLIYAYEQENIAITGEGTIDGQADCSHWWPWKGRSVCGSQTAGPEQSKARSLLVEMVARGDAVSNRVFGYGNYLRPQFIEPYRCKNVLIEGVTLKRSPMWHVHPVLCTNVTVRNLKIISDGPNTDGCDPESCKDVLIQDCYFSTGDDCIAIKSGRNNDGRRVPVPSENIIIRGCRMNQGHGGITVGSEISAGVRNVFAERCTMDSPSLNQALRFKNNAVRGGLLENFYFRNIEVGQVAEAVIAVDFNYEEGANGPFTPVLRNVVISALKSHKSKYALNLQGLPKAPIANVTLNDCIFENVGNGNILKNVAGLEMHKVELNGKAVTAEALR